MPHAVMDVSKRVNENEPVEEVWQHGSGRADRFSGHISPLFLNCAVAVDRLPLVAASYQRRRSSDAGSKRVTRLAYYAAYY